MAHVKTFDVGAIGRCVDVDAAGVRRRSSGGVGINTLADCLGFRPLLAFVSVLAFAAAATLPAAATVGLFAEAALAFLGFLLRLALGFSSLAAFRSATSSSSSVTFRRRSVCFRLPRLVSVSGVGKDSAAAVAVIPMTSTLGTTCPPPR